MKRPESAEEVLSCLHAQHIDFQQLSARARQKNRVILQWRTLSGVLVSWVPLIFARLF